MKKKVLVIRDGEVSGWSNNLGHIEVSDDSIEIQPIYGKVSHVVRDSSDPVYGVDWLVVTGDIKNLALLFFKGKKVYVSTSNEKYIHQSGVNKKLIEEWGDLETLLTGNHTSRLGLSHYFGKPGSGVLEELGGVIYSKFPLYWISAESFIGENVDAHVLNHIKRYLQHQNELI